jgi:hypothetical protein
VVDLGDISEVDPDAPGNIMVPFPRCSMTGIVKKHQLEIPDFMRLVDGTTIRPTTDAAATLAALQEVAGEEGLVIASRWPSSFRHCLTSICFQV